MTYVKAGNDEHSVEFAIDGMAEIAMKAAKQNSNMTLAEKLFEVILGRISMRKPPFSHLVKLMAMRNLGLFYIQEGRYSEAEKLLLETFEGFNKLLGGDNVATIEITYCLGMLQTKKKQDLPLAERWTKDALGGLVQALGKESIMTLDAMSGLGVVYMMEGKNNDAEALFLKALDGYKKAPDPDHKLPLSTLNELGNLYTSCDKLPEAEAIYREVLFGNLKAYGDEDLHTLVPAENLGLVLKEEGKLDEAEELLRQAYEGLTRVLGKDNINTLHAAYFLGLILVKQKKLAEAEEPMRQAVEGLEKRLGRHNLFFLSAAAGLGGLFKELGKDEAGEKWIRIVNENASADQREQMIDGSTFEESLITT